TNHPAGYVLGELVLQELRPAGMVIEMPRHQRNINVATLADGLAVVHRLKNRHQPGMPLHQPRDGIQVARAGMRSERAPSGRRSSRGLDRHVNVRDRGLRNRRELLPVRRIDSVEILSRRGRLPTASHAMLETVAMAFQPGDCFLRILWSGPVFHAHEFFGYTHWRLLQPRNRIPNTPP